MDIQEKYGSDGSQCSFKAMLVAQGYSQKIGIDQYETFSPVVRFESVWAILALAVQNDLNVHHIDVCSAFLNGDLQEELYLQQPSGFKIPSKEQFVCKLNKGIYGLKQAPKCWNFTFDKLLKDLVFVQSSSDYVSIIHYVF